MLTILAVSPFIWKEKPGKFGFWYFTLNWLIGGGREYRSPPPAHGGRGYREQTIQGGRRTDVVLLFWITDKRVSQGTWKIIHFSLWQCWPNSMFSGNYVLSICHRHCINIIISHQIIFTGSSVHGPVKEEPGLDMTAWSHQTPGYQVPHDFDSNVFSTS